MADPIRVWLLNYIGPHPGIQTVAEHSTKFAMAHAYQTSYHCKVWLNTCQYCDRTPACQTSNQTCSDLGSKRGFPTTPISKVCHFSVGQNALWDGRTCPPGSCDAMRLCEEWLGWMGSSVCRPRPSQGAWILTNSGWYPRSGFWKFS